VDLPFDVRIDVRSRDLNQAILRAATLAGCTQREAEAIATYADSETLEDAARKLRITTRWLLILLGRARRRVDAPHNVAFVASLWSKYELSLREHELRG
jgi:DNA-binding CsgD family transcriptional regulator